MLGPFQRDALTPDSIPTEEKRNNALKVLLCIRDDVVGQNNNLCFLQEEKSKNISNTCFQYWQQKCLNSLQLKCKITGTKQNIGFSTISMTINWEYTKQEFTTSSCLSLQEWYIFCSKSKFATFVAEFMTFFTKTLCFIGRDKSMTTRSIHQKIIIFGHVNSFRNKKLQRH